jgi:hypothetical protein
MNLFFSASDHAGHRRIFIAMIGIDKITIEPFFKSCQPESWSGRDIFLSRPQFSSFLFDSQYNFKYSACLVKITYNTRMKEELIKQFKILAIELSKRQNELLEEAIKDILKKYGKKVN